MKLYFAPMEGLTDDRFRRVHAAHTGGADRYFTPFLAPNQNHRFSGREKREILPENNEGLPVVPQLLTNRAEHFLWAARELAAMGYPEINLNLGCPSGTVTAKKKGAGQLADLPALKRFLDEIFEGTPVPISIKTRLGVSDPAEFSALLALFRQYPLAELILHPRVREEFYQGTPHLEAFAEAFACGSFPVCYNGGLFTPNDVARFSERFPKTEAVMLGRGALVNPGLFAEIRGGGRLSKAQLYAFHGQLYESYREAFSGERPVLCRMKEIWRYLHQLFADSARQAKALKKASSLREYEAVVNFIFRELEVVRGADYPVSL